MDYAYVDEESCLLLNNNEYSKRLEDYIVRRKIIQTIGKADMAAEPRWGEKLKSFLALLLAI
ncbi:MAG TPA: hypothetical protein DEQ17_06595 [Prevotella sp.]|nr:hypothetical protein [Prevotella sp.]